MASPSALFTHGLRVAPVRLIPLSLIFAIVIAMPAWLSAPARVAASTESSMATTVLTLMNRDRAARGLVGLRADSRLGTLAANRANWMASTGTMSHDSYGGAVFEAIPSTGVDAWSSGEAIGSTTATYGTESAAYLYGLWADSPDHMALMMSGTFNYIGIGFAYSGAGETFGSLVFAEAPDISRPVSHMTGAGHSGQTVFFTWSGRDGQLQSHTAGLRDFDVQYRVDAGSWSVIRTHTTSTQLILTNRPLGHTYSVRVRDRDRRNNLSAWSAIRSVRI